MDPPSGRGDGLPAFQMGKWNIFVLWNLIIDVAQVLIYLLGSYFRYIMIKWDCLDWLEILCVPGLVDSVTLCGSRDYSPPGSSVHGDSPGKNTGVGCHALFQGIFPTQGSNPGLPHCRWILYHLSHKASPRILEWVVMPSSRRSS